MTIGRSARILLSAIAFLLAASASVAAQTNDEIFPQFQWNFSTPGARANAMGRAFIGMADDATATITNPAGLVSLTRPQMYLEFKNTSLDVDRLAAPDSLFTGTAKTFSTDVNALSFFNLSMPVGSRLALGFTVHQFLNYQEDFELDPREIPDSPEGFVFFPVKGSADFKGTTYGFSASAMVSPKINVGLTVSANRLAAQSEATRNGINFSASPAADNGIIANRTSIDATSTAVGFSWGVLFKPSDKISIGLMNVIGPEFKIQEDFQTNPGFGTNTNQPLVDRPELGAPVTISVPNRFGGGLALRPNPKWVFAFDAVWIQYSSLTKDFALVFNADDDLIGDEYVIKDVTETHFGAEYNVRGGNMPIFLRAGLFTSPNHAVKFDPPFPGALTDETIAAETALYNSLPRDMETRGTIGAGFVFGQRGQLDVAYVVGKEFVVSTAIRFR